MDGHQYYFVGAEEFQSLVESDELIEHTMIKREKLTKAGRNKYMRASVESLDNLVVEEEQYYGMTLGALHEAQRVGSTCVVLVLDMDGAKRWKENPPDAEMKVGFVFIRVGIVEMVFLMIYLYLSLSVCLTAYSSIHPFIGVHVHLSVFSVSV